MRKTRLDRLISRLFVLYWTWRFRWSDYPADGYEFTLRLGVWREQAGELRVERMGGWREVRSLRERREAIGLRSVKGGVE